MRVLWVCGKPGESGGAGAATAGGVTSDGDAVSRDEVSGASAPRAEVSGAAAPGAMAAGLLGGTFDPPHLGHLIIAEAARVALDLGKVLFIPAALQPHKADREVTPAFQRWEMVLQAIHGNESFEACDLELRRGGPSFTADTVAELKRAGTGGPLYFVCGADALEEMATWHDPGRILSNAVVAVARRPGAAGERRLKSLAAGLTRAFGGKVVGFHAPLIHVSSTLIRTMAERGDSIRYLVPERVFGYIREQRLYTGGISR